MSSIHSNRSTTCFDVGLDAVGQTLAIIIIGVGDRSRLNAVVLEDCGNNLSLPCIRR